MFLEVLFIALTSHATAPLSPSELAPYQTCSTDDDCVYAQNGSCDCNNGGMGVAINKTKAVEFAKLFESVACTKINGSSCLVGIPKCEQNKCMYYFRAIPRFKKKDSKK
jgi:hypothetical protein